MDDKLTISENDSLIIYNYLNLNNVKKNLNFKFIKKNEQLWFADRFKIIENSTLSFKDISNIEFKRYELSKPEVDGNGPFFFNRNYGVLNLDNGWGKQWLFLKEASNSIFADSIFKHIYLNLQLTDSYKLEFLNQILSDSTKNRVLENKDELISNIIILPPPVTLIDFENSNKTPKHTEFIAHKLNIDVKLVESQMQSNKSFDFLKLRDFNYNILDIRSYANANNLVDSLHKITKNYYKNQSLNNNLSLLNISVPIFNKELNLAYIRLRKEAGGRSIIYKKVENKWFIKEQFNEWVE